MEELNKNSINQANQEPVGDSPPSPATPEQNTNSPLSGQAEAPSSDPQSTPPPPAPAPSTPTQTPPAPAPKPETPPSKPKNQTKKLLIVALVVFLATAGLAAAGYFLFVKKASENVTQNQEISKNPENPQNNTPDTPKDTPGAKVTFLDKWEKKDYVPIFDETIFSGNVGYNKSEFRFYKVGSYADKDILMLSVTLQPGFWMPNYAVLLSDGSSYKLLKNHSPDAFEDGKYKGPKLADSASIDYSTTIEDLMIPKSVDFGGITATRKGESVYTKEGFPNYKLTEVKRLGKKIIYEAVEPNKDHVGVKNMTILLKLPNQMYVPYHYVADGLSDDYSFSVKLDAGGTLSGKYDWIAFSHGCGQVEAINVVDKDYFKELVKIGTSSGQDVFKPKNTQTKIFQSAYKQYLEGTSSQSALSKQEVYNKNLILFVRNKLGYKAVLSNKEFAAGGECGKPVVYLYPEQTERLSVRVGANVRVSEPEYGNGWFDVLAKPNGQLNYQGQNYPYLFWEGQGFGRYPEVKSGFVVRSSEVSRVLRQQLASQGLNRQEIADFMEFWMPKMPTHKPYIRLSWLSLEQMNRLAPLHISKQPDTLIRVFLEFEGLDRWQKLPTQKLQAPQRRGFVVVEWGGLLQ